MWTAAGGAPRLFQMAEIPFYGSRGLEEQEMTQWASGWNETRRSWRSWWGELSSLQGKRLLALGAA